MGLTVAELRSVFTADTSDIDRAQNRIRSDTRKTQGVLKTAAGTMTGFLGANLATGAVRGVVGLIKTSSQLEQKYSKTMSLMAAATGAPASQLDELDKLAMKLGADTQYSAGEAADAMLELAKAGVSTKDIMGGGLQSTLLLASAGGTDLGTAATIASNAMNTFNLRGKQMKQVAAALAGGANASSASVESLGQGLAQVGPGAKNAGLSLQETVATLSAFDAAGIKGSDAGTSLKTMLANLVPQTEAASTAMEEYNLNFVDAEGNFVSIANVAKQLKAGLGGLSEAQRTQALTTLFGSDASRAATVLMDEGSKGIRRYIRATQDQKAAQKLSDAAMSGTAGAMEKLSGSVETAELAIGKALGPAIEDTANWLSDDAVPAVTDFIEGMQDGTGAGGDFADTLGDVKDILGDVVDIGEGVLDFFNAIPGPVKKYGAELALVGFGMSKFTGGTSSAIASSKSFYTELTTTEGGLQKVKKSAGAFGGALRNVAGAGGMLAMQHGLQRTNTGLGLLETAVGGALTGFAMTGGSPVGAAVGGLGALAVGVVKSRDAMKDAEQPAIDYASSLDEISGAATKATRTTIRLGLSQREGAFAAAEAIGISSRDMVSYLMGNKGAIERVNQALADSKGEVIQWTDAWGQTQTAYSGSAAELQIVQAALGVVGKDLDAAGKKVRDQAVDVGDLAKVYKGIPRRMIKEISLVRGGDFTGKGGYDEIVKLARNLKMMPKDIRILLRANNFEAGDKAVQRIIDKAKELGKKPPKITPEVDGKPAEKGLGGLLGDLFGTAKKKPTKLAPKVDGAPAKAQLGGLLGDLQLAADRNPINIKTHRSDPTGGPGSGDSGRGGDSDPRMAAPDSGQTSSDAFTVTGEDTLDGMGRSTGRSQKKAPRKTEGTHLEILESRQGVRDLERQLAEKNKKGRYVVRGLDRKVLMAQLAAAQRELDKLLAPYVDEQANEAIKQAEAEKLQAVKDAAASFTDQLASSQGLFSTGATTSSQALQNLITDETTNDQWATLLTALADGGASQALLNEFKAKGPSAQSLALGNSILSSGTIGDFNKVLGNLTSGQTAIGSAAATGNYTGLPAMVHIDTFNANNQDPAEIGQRLYFQSQIQK